MGKSEAPTLFQCGNAQSLLDWGDYCLDLTGTSVLDEMTTADFNLVEDGAVKAIGYCYEAFGIIVNKALLAQAGYSIEDITDFASLKAIAEDIHKNADKLGFDAFTSSGMDDSSSWRFSGHLANVALYYESVEDNWTECPAEIKGTYLENFKNLWDLYINNAAVTPDTLATGGYDAAGEFKAAKAVFYQNGSWEYAGLVDAGMNPEKLAMIPFYAGVEGEEKAGLNCGTENCWAVNAKASEADIKATIDFMTWMVTSAEGTNVMAEQFGPIPYKKAATPENVFFADALEYTANGCYTMTWAFNYTPNVNEWRAGLVSAMNQYDAGTGTWEDVVTAFVQGWAQQYKNANG